MPVTLLFSDCYCSPFKNTIQKHYNVFTPEYRSVLFVLRELCTSTVTQLATLNTKVGYCIGPPRLGLAAEKRHSGCGSLSKSSFFKIFLEESAHACSKYKCAVVFWSEAHFSGVIVPSSVDIFDKRGQRRCHGLQLLGEIRGHSWLLINVVT